MLLECPVLAVYDNNLPTFIYTDESDYGLSAVLTQMHSDGVERAVAFASQSLSPGKRMYSTFEKEALAYMPGWWRSVQRTVCVGT